jgi:4-amino-4-deoxy-L-arabinose transferase-like glycosyltransferase
LITLGLFTLALIPRAVAQGTFITVDEAYHWFERADVFLRALQSGNYIETNQVGHPGVTTMWLGAIGLMLKQFLAGLGWINGDSFDLQRVFLRLPVAIVTALCVVIGHALLRRLFRERVALLAALFWALDPFMIAHSQLLHTDALVSSFMTISLLAAFVAFRADAASSDSDEAIRWPLLVVSAVAGGLAVLTKSPSIVLIPMLGLTAVMTGWRSATWQRRLPVLPLLAWGGIAALVWFALWPAAWVNFFQALSSMYRQARYDGGVPHAWGNFFFGQAVADPGLLFYLVAVPFRLTPWTLLGVILCIVASIWARRELPDQMPLRLLAIFVTIFLLMLSVLAKKFDRYALPVFPALNIIAAIGWVWLASRIRQWLAAWRTGAPVTALNQQHARWLSGAVVVAVLCANVAWYHPYELAYYNQALGGGRAAVKAIPVGWGEGYEQVGAFLSKQYNGCARPSATWFSAVLRPYLCAPVVGLSWALKPGAIGYAILYIDQIQRNDAPEVTAALLGKTKPLHVVHIHGIDYAYIYHIHPPIAHPASASFGSALRFRGYDLDTSTLRDRGIVSLNLHWSALAPVKDDHTFFLHILNERGERVGQADLPLVGTNAQLPSWTPDDYTIWGQQIPLPANIPAGNYWLALGVYTPSDGQRLPLKETRPPGAPNDGENALLLGPITIP